MLYLENSAPGTPTNELSEYSACRTWMTTAGAIYLRDDCSPSFVAGLRADDGLHAFARRPKREHELLLKIAGSENSKLTLAYTGEGAIIGQVTTADPGVWWPGMTMVREVAIEVSANWRKLGIARQLIELVLAREDIEDWILLALGLSWHWEPEQLGLTRARYRAFLAQLLAPYGFVEYLTTEPNIREDPANILLARLGNRIGQTAIEQFYTCLLRSETLPGM